MKQRRAIDIRILGKKRTGDETVFFELTREVLRQDTEHEYLLLTNEANPEALTHLHTRLELDPMDTKRKIVTLVATNRFWWNLWVLPSFLWREKITLLHTQYILPFWIPVYTKVINHIHDVSFCALPEYIGAKDLFFLRLLIPRSLRMSTAIVVPSQFTKDEVIKYYQVPKEKVHVITNALRSGFLAQLNEEKSDTALRAQYHLPDSFLLYVGTLQPRKNIPLLIEAFAQYRARFPETALVLVGNKQGHHYDQRIDTTIQTLEEEAHVLFPGYVDEADLPRIFRMAEVFVFPSRYEGFGIPLLEAMSQAVPVLASDRAVLREVGGDAALYFDPESVDALVQKLYSLKDSVAQKESLIQKGKARIQDFSWQKSGTQLLALYQSSQEE